MSRSMQIAAAVAVALGASGAALATPPSLVSRRRRPRGLLGSTSRAHPPPRTASLPLLQDQPPRRCQRMR